jgi:hypothetical protein
MRLATESESSNSEAAGPPPDRETTGSAETTSSGQKPGNVVEQSEPAGPHAAEIRAADSSHSLNSKPQSADRAPEPDENQKRRRATMLPNWRAEDFDTKVWISRFSDEHRGEIWGKVGAIATVLSVIVAVIAWRHCHLRGRSLDLPHAKEEVTATAAAMVAAMVAAGETAVANSYIFCSGRFCSCSRRAF